MQAIGGLGVMAVFHPKRTLDAAPSNVGIDLVGSGSLFESVDPALPSRERAPRASTRRLANFRTFRDFEGHEVGEVGDPPFRPGLGDNSWEK